MLGKRKGKQRREYVPDYVLYDLETTGISSLYDEVIEISAVKVRNGKIVDEFSELVNPGRPIPYAASSVNNISDKMVENARSFEKVLPEFLAFAGDDVLAGHNIAGFDMKFLYRDCEKYFGQTLTNDYIDTLAIAKLCFPEWKHRKLSDLAEHYGISTKGAHRALADCRMNQQVFELMAKESGGTSAKQTEGTTNPAVATGDGIAMVHRAKGAVENMQFLQFHPTSLYNPGERPSFLISEAMRGFGALLRLQNGKEFMHKYHPMGSLAPRDVVARSIDHEMKISGDEFVYLDITHKDPKEVINHFPNIYQKCLSVGIDLTKDMIPVVPAAHYCCGGVKVNLNGESSIRHLYALGETSSTGLHGGNRLASNSLMEAAVYADVAAQHAISLLNTIELQRNIPAWDYEGTAIPEEMALITQNYKEMQLIMSNYVGIVRSNLRLERAKRRLEIIFKETEELYLKSTLSQHLCELRNMIAVGYLIIKQAEAMHESVGLHYSIDYPAKPVNME